MFNTISWQGYWTVIVLLLTGYYGLVYLLYFRKDFSFHFPARAKSAVIARQEPVISPSAEEAAPEFDLPDSGSEEAVIYSCLDEINAFFEAQRRSKAVKPQILFGVKGILQKYPSLKDSSYQATLCNVIATQCEAVCSIHISAEELKGAWLGS